MNVLKEIVLNQLIKIPAVKTKAKKYHQTGLSHNPESLMKTYASLVKHSPIKDKDILELGPGKTIDIVLKAKQDGAASVSIVDIERYLTDRQISDNEINYKIYDGKRMPFEDESFDLIWSNDVYEHIRYPQTTVEETYRLLRSGGMVVHIIDLLDHFSYGTNNPDIVLNCLKYPQWLWEMMTWNRSNYVNRLRASDWVKLHESNGFKVIGEHTEINAYVRDNYKTKSNFRYLLNYTEHDAISSVLYLSAQKL